MDTAPHRNFYRLTTDEALKELTTTADGLSAREAASRLAKHGPNALQAVNKESSLHKYLKQFKDLMVILLIVSSVISFSLGDARTGLVLLLLVFFNTTIGFLQEFKAERLMESLEKLVVSHARVQRQGELQEVASEELVPGDIVYIEEGDAVPADLRLISEEELSTNDFALTGESNPTRKFLHAISGSVPLASRQNLVFMGTTVATGHGFGAVIGTGMQTELGRIASLSEAIDTELSPLQKEMNHIAGRVTQGTVILCAILLPVAIHGGLPIKDAFLFAIGIASSIIPQGLPAEINTALAQAASKLARARALVKKLSAVETLGATSVICTDKTGTLTKNQMTVEQLFINNQAYAVTGKGYEPAGAVSDEKGAPLSKAKLSRLKLFFATAAMASNARVTKPDREHAVWRTIGDPTEGALVTLAMKGGLDPQQLDSDYPELHEFTFDSARKRMSSVRKYGPRKQLHLFVKGAPENILERCSRIAINGRIRPLTRKDRAVLLARNEAMAGQAMRNLAMAYRILPARTDVGKLTIDSAESDLVWLGMASMIDPLRPEVPAAMAAARKAHVKVSIVTGDNAITAQAIAARAKLTDSADDIVIVTGDELQDLSDTQVLNHVLKGGVIFSRVAPEDKLRIVGLVQARGHIVAVTGDGINDAPALKRADIGVAMGKTGTDVAKQSAEIVLLDDSFHTLVGAIQQGRTIFQNIRKGTLSCFTSNAAELVVNLVSLAAATALHVPLALSVMEILAIDLIAELFPIAALGWDKADGEIMTDEPRNPDDHILNGRSIIDLLWCGLLIGGLAFGNFIWFFCRHGYQLSGIQAVVSHSPIHMKATALTYLTIVLCQLLNILQRRSRGGLFSRYQLHNQQLWLAMLFSVFCVANIIYNPWIAPYFQAGPLGFVDVLCAIAAALIFVLIREAQRHDTKHRRKAVSALHHQHKHLFEHPKLAR